MTPFSVTINLKPNLFFEFREHLLVRVKFESEIGGPYVVPVSVPEPPSSSELEYY
jgi:hypothetical protein